MIIEITKALNSPGYERIVHWLSLAANGNLRAQGYREAREMSTPTALGWIIDSLERYEDERAARTMIYKCDDAVLASRFDRFRASLSHNQFLLSKLYIRLGHCSAQALAELKDLNAISYVYTCLKLGVPIATGEFRAIYMASMFDIDSGLLVWCFGQLGEWDLLLELSPLIEDPPREAIEAHFASMGVALPPPVANGDAEPPRRGSSAIR